VSTTEPTGALARLGVGLVVLETGLWALGAAVPGPPGSWQIERWVGWVDLVGPAGVTMGLVRLLAMVACGYLLLVATVELAGRRLGAPRLLRAGRRGWAPGVARLLGPAAGVGLLLCASGGMLAASPAGAADPAPVIMQVISTGPGVTASPSSPSTAPTTPASSVSSTSAPPPPTGPPPTGPAPTPGAAPIAGSAPTSPTPARPTPTDPATVQPDSAADQTWLIRPGDHLWHVSSSTLTRVWGTPPSNAEIAEYLDELIAANRDRLVVPGNADLVYPGQVFELPDVPARRP
jgi:nucleoid-associated protein YgaU